MAGVKENIMTTENLFIIFPPGLGGNHLANLISLTPRFKRDVDFLQYDQNLESAHFSKIENLRQSQIANNLDQLLIQNNVFCGHLGEYIWLKNDGILQKFNNRKFLIIQLSDNINSVAHRRIVNWFTPYQEDYFRNEQRTLYSQNCIESLLDEYDFFQIPSEVIFSEDSSLLFDFIETEFNTTINRVTAGEYHSIWFKSIKSNLP